MNYNDLIALLPQYAHRSGLTALFPTFISLFEKHANRKLRVAEMEAEATATGTNINLPTDFLEMRSVKSGTNVIEYVTPDRLLDYDSGAASVYTLTGTQIKLNANATITYVYYQSIPAISPSQTNWLMDKHNDVYLFGTIAELYGYTRNDEQAQKYMAMRDAVLGSIKTADKGRRWSGAPLRVNSSNRMVV